MALSTLSLVTMNTFGVPAQKTRVRLRTLARELNTANLDVVCFQEVQLSLYATLVRREFHTLPHAAYKPHIYAPKGGLMTLSTHPHQHVEFHPYQNRRARLGPSLADWALYKGALVVELTVGATSVIIMNTHLNANYDGDWSPRNRYALIEHGQLRQLIKMLEEIERSTLVVIAGDFNFPRSSWLYNEFVSETGVIDPLAVRTEPTYRPLRILPAHFAQPIDFIFVRPPRGVLIQAQGATLFEDHVHFVDGRRGYLSDHHAIRVDIAW